MFLNVDYGTGFIERKPKLMQFDTKLNASLLHLVLEM